MADDARIIAVVNQWVSYRDKLTARNTIMGPQQGQQSEFIETLDANAIRLGNELPDMSHAELQGFSELVSELLTLRINKLDPFKRK
jgi:hypothetical protein